MATLPTVIDEKINQDSEMRMSQRVVTANYGDFYEQRAGIGIDAFSDAWTLNIGPVEKSVLDTFRTFWFNHGFAESFDWQAPEDSASKKWVFASEPSITNNAQVYIITVDIRQVRE